jgi:hypothetical protein
MTKLLKISALSAFALFFAACDPEMAGADVEDRALHGKMLDIADSDGDDDGFQIWDDFSDAVPAPAPMVEYDLDLAAEDEEPCDTWGPDGDLDLDGGADDQAAIDGQRPFGIDPDHGEETWGPDEDLDIGDGDGAGESPSDDDEPPIGTPDDDDDDWGDLDFDGDNNSGDGDGDGLIGEDEPPIGNPDGDDDGWGDLDFDGDNNSGDDDDDIDDIDGN